MIKETIVKEFSNRNIILPQDFDIHNLEKYCGKKCHKICGGTNGIEVKRGIFLWQFGFCKGPYSE